LLFEKAGASESTARGAARVDLTRAPVGPVAAALPECGPVSGRTATDHG
jgi:hypothetical protein